MKLSKKTKVAVGTLNPQWDETLLFDVDSWAGIKVRVFDKHRLRSDKFLGQVTLRFNTELLLGEEMLNEFFPLAKRKQKEVVKGDIHLRIVYGDPSQKKPAKEESSSEEVASSSSTEAPPDPPLVNDPVEIPPVAPVAPVTPTAAPKPEEKKPEDLRRSGITASGERKLLSAEEVKRIQEDKERKQKEEQDALRASAFWTGKAEDLRQSAVVLVPEDDIDDDDYPDDDHDEIASDEYEYDEIEFEANDDHVPSNSKAVSLTASQIVLERSHQVDTVAEICQIPTHIAQALLQFFQWDKEKLLAQFMEDSEKVYANAKVEKPNSLRATQLDVGHEIVCNICFDDTDEVTCLSCKHYFCNNCWGDYLNVKIKEGDIVALHCMAPNCKQVISDTLIQKLVSKENWSKYARFQAASFVDSNPNMKWCPAPGCGNAVDRALAAIEGKNEVALCKCGTKFCFTCLKTAHTPVDCETVNKWEKKCNDDSETANWLASHTKPCPRCKAPIEKNDGCFQMTCAGCRHQFCWLCCQDWATHGDHFSCAKYRGVALENKPKWMDDADSKAKEAGALQLYMHYYERYTEHANSQKQESGLRKKVEEHKVALVASGESPISVGFVDEAMEQLAQLRRTLMWTYVWAYYQTDPVRKELFELQQGDLESLAEKLNRILLSEPGKLDRDGLKGLTRVAHSCLYKLLIDENL